MLIVTDADWYKDFEFKSFTSDLINFTLFFILYLFKISISFLSTFSPPKHTRSKFALIILFCYDI